MQRKEQAVPDLHTCGVEMTAVEKVETFLKNGFERLEFGDKVQGWRFVKQALSVDPGISPTYSSLANPIRANLQRILNEARLPSTFTWLAAICRQINDEQTSRILLRRYLEVAPYAADREQIIRYLENRIESGNRIRPFGWLNSALSRPWSWLRLRVRRRTRLRLR